MNHHALAAALDWLFRARVLEWHYRPPLGARRRARPDGTMIGCGPRLSEDKYIRFTLCLRRAPEALLLPPRQSQVGLRDKSSSIGAYKAIRVDGCGVADIRPCF
jgi:hypothetical protein